MEVGPVLDCLEECFKTWGAPLVLKSDNESAFSSEVMEQFLRRKGVRHLLSPPRRPQYNGEVEASIRWLKARTEEEAFQAGRHGSWASEEMQKAKHSANTARRRRGGAAHDAWLARDPIAEETRSAFAATVRAEEIAALKRARSHLRPEPHHPPTAAGPSRFDPPGARRARHSLFQRRSVPLPLNRGQGVVSTTGVHLDQA
jgi:hypothetical protein